MVATPGNAHAIDVHGVYVVFKHQTYSEPYGLGAEAATEGGEKRKRGRIRHESEERLRKKEEKWLAKCTRHTISSIMRQYLIVFSPLTVTLW